MKDKKMTQYGRTQSTQMASTDAYRSVGQNSCQFVRTDQMITQKKISLLLTLLLTLALFSQSLLAAVWPQAGLNASGQTLTDSETPVSADDATLLFQVMAKDADSYDSLSNVILVDDAIFIASGSNLIKFDKQGQEVARVSFSGMLQSWAASLVYHEGYLYGFVSDGSEGYLEAIRTTDMSVAWRSNGIAAQEAYSALVLADNTLYVTTNAYNPDTWGAGVPGHILALSLSAAVQAESQPELEVLLASDEDVFSSNKPAVSDQYLYVGTQSGDLLSIHLETGDLQRLRTGKPIKTGMTLVNDTLYFGNTEGIMQVSLDEQGQPDADSIRQIDLGMQVTTVPVINQNLMFAGTGGFQGGRGLAVIDLVNFELLYTAEMSGIDFYGEVIESTGVQSQPLLTTAYTDAIYVYYTYNAKPGGLYVLRHQNGQTSADVSMLSEPEEAAQNSTMSVITADEAGTLYYTNDTGYLFAIGTGTADLIDEETPDSTDTETPDSTDTETSDKTENPDTGRPGTNLWVALLILAALATIQLLQHRLKASKLKQ